MKLERASLWRADEIASERLALHFICYDASRFAWPSIHSRETLNDTACFRRRFLGTGATFWFICRLVIGASRRDGTRFYICMTGRTFSMPPLRLLESSGKSMKPRSD